MIDRTDPTKVHVFVGNPTKDGAHRTFQVSHNQAAALRSLSPTPVSETIRMSVMPKTPEEFEQIVNILTPRGPK